MPGVADTDGQYIIDPTWGSQYLQIHVGTLRLLLLLLLLLLQLRVKATTCASNLQLRRFRRGAGAGTVVWQHPSSSLTQLQQHGGIQRFQMRLQN